MNKDGVERQFVLPPSIIDRADLARLASEVEQIDNAMVTTQARAHAGVNDTSSLAISGQLRDFLSQNTITLEDETVRSELIRELRRLKNEAPIIHMTFAVPADSESVAHLIQWVRTSVAPQAVIETSLQPSLIAGVYIRTPNHVHDLSLRGLLHGQHAALVKELESLRGAK